MEAVGLLAGGVAHDYNNMLSVILGYTELALGKVDPAESLHADLDEIYKAAMRSTDITRQLLAFARKQTINPVVLDLNQNVQSMLKMLRRLIGENITLAWLPEAGLYPIKMDPAQTDQLLANLCVNARDAIGLATEYAGEIRLLVTDVVMPEMNDRDLAERLQSLYPDMKILFMSGYTASVIAHRGVLDEGVNFLQKPFSIKDLAVKIQDAMRGN